MWSFLLFGLAAHAAPVISEFLADNDGGLLDEDREDQDWIEIHNPDPSAVNLAGWSLTDDGSRPAKWIFPSRVLQPGARIVVFASEKDRKPATGNLHTNFQLDQDGEYLALVPPGGGPPSTEFAPVYPFQSASRSYGFGFSGTVTTTDATPTSFIAGTNYNRVKLSGVAASAADGSLNNFDDSLAQPEHQQYMWFDYSSRLGNIPAGTVVEATLEWPGKAEIFAGASGLNTVPTAISVYQPSDGAKGVTSVALSADGKSIVNYTTANQPVASVNVLPGESKNFIWNVTSLVTSWRNNPAQPGYGQIMLLNTAQPSWIGWDQNRRGPKLTVRTVSTPNPVSAWGFMAVSAGNPNTGVVTAGPLIRELTENPPRPAADTVVTVTARVQPLQGGAVSSVTLFYRRAYTTEGTLTMKDDGTDGDAIAGDTIYTAQIPAAAVLSGQMVRWRAVAVDAAGFSSTMPPFREATGSPQYFGTVPLENPAIATQLPMLRLFILNPSAAATTSGTRASMFLNGEFYDNIGIKIHGQSTQGGAFLKKSYNIDGTRGYRFKWSMDPLQPRAKDINLLTVYADKTRVRHDLAYEMNREAGVHAHYCFLTRVHMNGTYNGLYDFGEDGDDVYLERAGLNKDGALYKMYNAMSNPASDAVTGAEKKARKTENNADLYAFLVGMNLADANARRAFLYDNVDIPKMINFMAANTVTGNVDLHAKNYYIYRDTGKTNLWTLLPWDLDLSQGRLWTSANNYFDDGMYVNAGGTLSGSGQNLVARMYSVSEFSLQARRRIRTLQDKFFKTSAVVPDMTRWYDRRLSEMAAMVGASITAGGVDIPGSDAALDFTAFARASWRNPAPATTVSPFTNNTMSQELQRVASSWILQRIQTINSDGNVPAALNLNALAPLTFASIEHSPASKDQDQEYIRISNPNSVAIDLSGWTISGGVDFTFEPGTVINASNSIYVAASRNAFKARTVSPKGGESLYVVGGFSGHLSNLGETLILKDNSGVQRATISYPGSASDYQRYLVVSEVMYNPGGDGLAEFIELTNISSSVPLNLAGVRFTNGIDFDFTGSSVTTLAPGARVLVVRNRDAFFRERGPEFPVAGEFANSTALNNAGEDIKLEDPDNNTVAEFTYDDAAPWPVAAAGAGASMVLIRPDLNPDPALPQNWRASIAIGGNPGKSDAVHFTGPPADLDGDGISSLLEYLLGTSDAVPGALNLPVTSGTDPETGKYFEIKVPRQTSAEDAALRIEHSADLSAWSPDGWVRKISAPAETPGVMMETWRLTGAPLSAANLFVRVRATLVP